ncbi:MAG: hypothetical protein JRF40_14615 [Deltaproteobacteria bacterium]|nr:hypothetical protein [Deltaproteobacteria bacterium]
MDNGETLINCLAYIDLNPVRAGIVEKPEDYRWCSLGYHVQFGNKDDFLSLDFGLKEFGLEDENERLRHYRQFVYEKGHIEAGKPRGQEAGKQKEKESGKGFEISGVDRFRYRTRYFTDSGIIGSKAFVTMHYRVFKDLFSSKHEKKPKMILGLDGVYSLKRLSEKT